MSVFISGSGKDGWLINSVRQLLGRLSVNSYWAALDAPAGPPIPKIADKLEKSQAVFVFWTKNVSRASSVRDYVIYELTKAAEAGKLHIFKEKGAGKSSLLEHLGSWKPFDSTDLESINMTLKKIAEIVEKELPGERTRMAIILAAGKGTRMDPIFSDLPKTLIPVREGSTILDEEIQSLIDCGHDPANIIMVTGHLRSKISKHIRKNYPLMRPVLVTSARQKDYEMMGSLWKAFNKLDLNEGCIILYGDIVFDKQILKRLKHMDADIAMLVDTNPNPRYDLRNSYVDFDRGERDHKYEEEAEKVWVDQKGICGIGKCKLGWEGDLKGEFTGIMKLATAGVDLFLTYIREYNSEFNKGKLPRIAKGKARPLRAVYVVEFLQYLIEKGESESIELCCMDLHQRYYEFDTPSDVEAWKKFRKGFVWDSSLE